MLPGQHWVRCWWPGLRNCRRRIPVTSMEPLVDQAGLAAQPDDCLPLYRLRFLRQNVGTEAGREQLGSSVLGTPDTSSAWSMDRAAVAVPSNLRRLGPPHLRNVCTEVPGNIRGTAPLVSPRA